jgi:hypothetical protein
MMPSSNLVCAALCALEKDLVFFALPFLVLMGIKPLTISKLGVYCLNEALVVFEELTHVIFLQRESIAFNKLLEMIILNLVMQKFTFLCTYGYVPGLPP